MKAILYALILLQLAAFSLAQATNSQHFFIVQISPVIDGKAAKPSNFTITRDTSATLTHTLSVSSTNFLKNVTIGLQLFAWYNGNWISKKPRTLQITDRRRIFTPLQKHMLHFMKYADLNNLNAKEPVVLNETAIYISYDPEGSLMTSQLQQPHLFIPNSNYMPVKDINRSIQRINTTLSFRVVHKTDEFIQNKRALSQLAQIQAKATEVFPIIAHPFNKELIQPNQIMEVFRKNLQTLAGQQRKVGEKIQLISRYGFKPFLGRDIHKLDVVQEYFPIYDYLAQFKLSFKDTLGPIWQWIFAQPFVLAGIDTLQSAFLRQSHILVHNNILKQLSSSAKLKQNIQLVVFGVWILLDLLSYCFYSRNLGISSSNGTFFNILLLVQLISVSLRVALASIWYLGLIVFFTGILVHFLFTYFIQKRVNNLQHSRSQSDLMLTSIVKNTLVLAVVVNIFMHLFSRSTITTARIWSEGFQVLNRLEASPILSILWSFSQFSDLLRQYYYVLILIPQIVLNFRLKNVQKTTLLRIILISALCYGEWRLNILNVDPLVMAFRFKEGILGVILVLQWLAYRKNAVQPLQPDQSSVQSQPKDEKQPLHQSPAGQAKKQ